MKILKFILLLIFVLLIFYPSLAGDKDTLISKARYYIQNGEPVLAIPLLKKYNSQFPGEFLPYELIGDCYAGINSFREAISSYLNVLKLKPDLVRLNYKLGNVYDIIEKSDSAIYYFRNYLNSDPNSVAANLRLAILFLNLPEGQKDSCLFYAKCALEIDPENNRAQNILAMSYFSLGNYELARKTAMIGLKRDSSDVNLLQTVGQCSFYLKEYKNAIEYFDKAIKIIPENTLLRDYMAQSILMQNTNPGKIFYNAEGRVKFYRIQSQYIDEIEKESLQISGSYSYKSLLGRFRENPGGLGLDEYFMLYFANSNQPEYSPYKTIDETLNKMLDIDLKKSAEMAEKLVLEYPVDFPLYLILAGIYKQRGEYNKYYENILRYFGFLEAVKATGEGTSLSSAWIITYTSHEKELAFNLGYTIQSQKYVTENGHNYDIISCRDSKGKEVTIYFNIDRPYLSLIRSMPGKKGNAGRKGK